MSKGIAKVFTDRTQTSSEYPTPDAIFDAADREFGPFTLDPATRIGLHSSEVLRLRHGMIATVRGTFTPFQDVEDGRYSYERIDTRNGLEIPWHGRVWLNPPYGRGEDGERPWVEKAYRSVREGNAELVCALIPVKSGIGWWQDYVIRHVTTMSSEPMPLWGGSSARLYHEFNANVNACGADIVRFLPGRVRFGDSTTGPKPFSAPFASALVVWRK